VDFSKRFLEKTPIPDGVRPYTISKLLGEAFALKMKNSINIRIGNVYGPECHVHNRIYGLISNRMKDEQMEVFDEAIDCIYIEDATEILAKLSGELMPPRDFALVTGELTPLKALISSIKKITPESKGDFTFAGSRQETPLLENKASRQLLGRDFTPLSTGLSLTVNFYRAKMLAEKVPILEKLLYKFLSVESLRKVISCVDVSLTGDFNGNARIKKTINNINAIACAALRKNIANWEEFVAATKPVFSEIKKLNDILLSIDQDESVLKLSSMLYINFIKEFKIFAEGKAGEEAIDKILKYCNDEIDAMLIGVSLEYNVQKMKKWFIQKGYCVLVGESGIFKRIHFHEILENEEYEVNGEKFNYYFMKPFGNIHQSVRRSYAWSERGDNNIFVVLSDELKSTDKGIQGTLQGTPYYISEKLRKEFYENNFEKSVRDFKKMDNLSADIIREEFQGMDETKIIRCLVDDAKEHEKRHQSNKLLRIIGYGNEVQEHEETSAFFAEIANAKCPKYTLIKLISYCINYLSLSSSSLHGTAAWHVIFPELFPEIMKVSRVIENKDRLEEILNVVKNISADELRQRAERAHLKLFNRPTVEARKVNRLRENERSNIGQLIDKTITEISAGETPDWMAQNFQPGLETVDEEFKGDIATVRKRLPAKKKLSLATEDEEVLARVEQALDQLVVHPKAGELTWLQLEAVGDILLRRVTGNDDIYQEHKQQMDNTVNSLYQEIREKVIAIEGFDEAFREAMIYAGIVNLLDLSHIGGIGQVDEVMNDFAEFKRKIRDLHAKVNKDGVIVDELDTFLTRLKQQPDGRVLYFLDNHGEVILDQIVIELLLRVGYKVSVVARESVVRDDVTRDEAIEIFGNNAIFSEYLENNSLKIVTDGSYLLGADLTKTEKHSDFQTAWKESFIAISKGAGNRRSMFGQCLSMPMLFTQMMKKSSSGYRQIENVRGEEIGNRKDYDLLLAYQSSKGFDKPFEIARSLIPRQYRGNGINQETLTNALREAGCSQIDPVKMDEKTAFIFSEKAVFDNGLGILLPKLAKAGIKIAVIARNARERELIEKLNNTELAGEKNKIVCADSVMEATSLVKGVARFYYFKLENDPEESMPANVALIDSFVVKQIIEAIGKASGLDIGMIERLHEAARQFAIAA
ncbi:MAG: DUF89 family protein, partial [Candidatus Omnitrophica bacterium]|nr:DUF89 family protein [Candidatus Omnitrophota bacterium]